MTTLERIIAESEAALKAASAEAISKQGHSAKKAPKQGSAKKPAKAPAAKKPAAKKAVAKKATAAKATAKKAADKKPVAKKPVSKKATGLKPAKTAKAAKPAKSAKAVKPVAANKAPKTARTATAKAQKAVKPTKATKPAKPAKTVKAAGKGTKAAKPIKPAKPTSAKATSKPRATAVAKGASKVASKANANSKSSMLFDTSDDRAEVVEHALKSKAVLRTLVDNLSTDKRRVRQFSASAVNAVSEINPELLSAHVYDIADALHRPEAQTRWECLEALSNIARLDPSACDSALTGAEVALYDEESGSLRLAALRFLCVYGATQVKRAEKVWPLIDEAIQLYHGDAEFSDMLIAITAFAGGHIGKKVKQALAERMSFDAEHSKKQLKYAAMQIIEICGGK
jgi:hypothetical protein